MKRNESRVARAIAGIAVLALLAWIVNGYIGEYRESAGDGPATQVPDPVSAPSTETGGAQPELEPGQSPAPASDKGSVVVLIDGLNLRKEARTDSPTLGGLEEGDKLTLISETEGWYEVQTVDGSRGWVSANPSYVRIEE